MQDLDSALPQDLYPRWQHEPACAIRCQATHSIPPASWSRTVHGDEPASPPRPNAARQQQDGPRKRLSGSRIHTRVTRTSAWLDETGAPLGVQQKLMRHAHVSTTMDQYGNASALAKRKAIGQSCNAFREDLPFSRSPSINKGNCEAVPLIGQLLQVPNCP
jgi:hypothetical protein